MKKISSEQLEALRAHAKKNPEDSYARIAATFCMSEITVKRYCKDIGRGKDWRRGRKQAPPKPDKFWASVDRTGDGCWAWEGCINESGYGAVHYEGKTQGSHRVAYTLTKGPIPEGMDLDHLCRNRICCNPNHLEPVTRAENMERARHAKIETVQLVQAAKIVVHEPLVYEPLVFEPADDFDTAINVGVKPESGVVPSVNKGDSTSEAKRVSAPVSVSIELPHQLSIEPLITQPPLVSACIEHRALAVEQYGPSPGQLTGDNFRYFWVGVPGIRTKMIARSAAEATAMFRRVWGQQQNPHCEEAGRPSDEVVKEWFLGWREYLSGLHKRWKASDLANFWVAIRRHEDRVQQAKIQPLDSGVASANTPEIGCAGN